MESLLRNEKLYKWLEQVDRELAQQAAAGGCWSCAGNLHRGDYKRKLRGGWEGIEGACAKRLSFCCALEGCRKRTTPPSVRFLGRKVYAGVVVVLISAIRHGISKKRLAVLREALGIDRRTLERWRVWWIEEFAEGSFWKAERGRFSEPVKTATMPLELVELFGAREPDGLVRLMKFLSPITTGSCKGVIAL